MPLTQMERTAAKDAMASLRIITHDRREDDPQRGFAHFGEFAQAVRARGMRPDGRQDERLMIGAAAPGTYGNEGIGAEGGFTVPPAFASEIWTLAGTEDALLPRCDNTKLGKSNSMVFPDDECLPWATDGMRGYWSGEAAAGTLTKPKLTEKTLRFSKLMALVPLTDELLADSQALASYLPERVGAAIRWKANEAILFGNGNGQPLGALNSGAAIVVAKESGQAASTVQALNLTKMVGRMIPGSYQRACWLLGQDTLPALLTLSLAGCPIMPPDASNPDHDGAVFILLGRPALESQHTAAFSSQGDITLVDLKYYRAISRLNTAWSFDLWFDVDVAAFRVTFRLDGQSKLAAAVAQAKGSNTLSPFVQLGAR